MKYLLLALISSYSSFAFSQTEEICDAKGGISNFEIELNTPCSRGIDNPAISDILTNGSQTVSIKDFCDHCKEPQLNGEAKAKHSNFNTENKKQFTKATLNELRKNLSGTMLDLMSLRSTFSVNFKPDEAISSCSIDQLAESKCKDGKSLKQLVSDTLGSEDSFQDIQKQLSYEISNTLNPPPYNAHGLIPRKASSCGIEDNELLSAKMKYWESLLTPEIILALKKSKIDDSKDLLSQLSNLDLTKKMQRDLKLASSHPMMQSTFKDGKELKSFLKLFPDEFGNEKVIENLFSEHNSTSFGKKLTNRCKTAFESIKKTFCSSEFKEGNLLFNNYPSMTMNLGDNALIENKEENLYSFCQGIKTKINKPMLFSSVNQDLSKDLPAKRKQLHFESLGQDHYKEAFLDPKENLCPYINAADCDAKDMNCAISKNLKAARIKDSPQSKLLASHDPNIDRILGSLIGSAPTVDTKTRTFLTEQGILPKADGTIVEAKDTQIRNPSTYSSSVKSFEEKTGPTPQPNTPSQINKTAKIDSPESWKGADVNNSDNNDDSNAETSGSPKKKNKKSNFESLSGDLDNNDEFKDKFTDRMNNLKNKKSLSKNKSANDEQDEENDYASGEKKSNSNTVLNGSSNIQSGSGTVTNPLATPTQITSGTKGGHVATIDNTRVEQSSLNKAIIQAQNRSPATSDNVANTKISLSKTDAGLNNIEIKVPDESVLSESTPALEKKIQTYLDDSDNSLQGAKTGEAYFVKLGNYEIKVAINDHGVYIAKCTKKCPNLSTEYLSFLSKYFTGIKTSGMSRVSLANIINKERDKNVRNNSENKKSLE